MVRKLATFALWTTAVWFGSGWYYQAQHVTPASQAIVDQFAATYCNLHHATSKTDADLQTVQSAMISRLAVSAGVGLLARAEYLKCAVSDF